MRSNPVRTLCLVSTLSLGCAAAAPASPTTPRAEAAGAERLSELEATLREREQEIRELRSRLALAQAEAEELRHRERPARAETVRIRSGDGEGDEDGLLFFDDEGGDDWEVPAEELPEEASNAPRPTLRLYGSPAVRLPDTALRAPDLPPASLPPNPLPATSSSGAWSATPVVARPAPVYVPPPALAPSRPRATAVDAQYREALGALRARRFEDALRAFEAFLRRAPTHPQAADARYWRGEVLYILRRYQDARAAFASYLSSHAAGRKAADALYKLALCHRRLGDEASARRALERLRRTYPNSVAARTASREAS